MINICGARQLNAKPIKLLYRQFYNQARKKKTILKYFHITNKSSTAAYYSQLMPNYVYPIPDEQQAFTYL